MSAPQDVLGEHPDIRRPTRDTRKTAMAPLHFKADRVGVIVMGVVGVIVCAVGLPLALVMTGKISSIPAMAAAAGGGAFLGLIFALQQAQQLSIEWLELNDDELAVGMKKQFYRFRWDAMTKVVQNYSPKEEWYIYTNEPTPAFRFSPESLAHADIKKMREFIKERIGYESQTDPNYATKAYKS
jgi:hypothetical protein